MLTTRTRPRRTREEIEAKADEAATALRTAILNDLLAMLEAPEPFETDAEWVDRLSPEVISRIWRIWNARKAGDEGLKNRPSRTEVIEDLLKLVEAPLWHAPAPSWMYKLPEKVGNRIMTLWALRKAGAHYMSENDFEFRLKEVDPKRQEVKNDPARRTEGAARSAVRNRRRRLQH